MCLSPAPPMMSSQQPALSLPQAPACPRQETQTVSRDPLTLLKFYYETHEK